MFFLRYPGGKSQGPICKRILGAISQTYTGGTFGELFFGGGGITFRLLERGLLDRILINEFDPSLADMWNLVIHDPGRLSRRVNLTVPSVKKFYQFKQDLLDGEVDGFKFLYVNRCSHGGRGVMAGVQGGYKQNTYFNLNWIWNKEYITRRIHYVHDLFATVKIVGNRCHNKDFAALFGKADYYYLDPPYWEVGDELYPFSFSEADHLRLRAGIETLPNWLLSYNNHRSVRRLYRDCRVRVASATGNGGTKRRSELIITPQLVKN